MMHDRPLTVAQDRSGDTCDRDSGGGISVEETNLLLPDLLFPVVVWRQGCLAGE